MRIKRLTETAKLPTKAYSGDLGYDLYSDENAYVRTGEIVKVKTGIAIKFPALVGGIIKDRSSLASTGLAVLGGVIDPHYQGEIVIILTSHLVDYRHYIGRGQKIAQLILTPVINEEIEETTETFLQSVRGDKGFGSSGA